METTVAMGPPGERYGLGLWRSRSLSIGSQNLVRCGSVWGHNGGFPGYWTDAFASRDGEHVFVLLVNQDPPPERAVPAMRRVLAAAAC